MKTKQATRQEWIKAISHASVVFIELLLGVRAGVDEGKRRRLRLLSAFLLLMTLVTLYGSFSLAPINVSTTYVMLGTAGLFLVSYFISRTRYTSLATILAIVLPAISPSAVVIFKLPAIDVTAALMWLALPVLIASLMLPLRKAFVVAAAYTIYISILAIISSFSIETFAPLITFLVVIAFFVISITSVRVQDQSEIEHQLQERRLIEKALRESEEKFSRVFMLSPQEICISALADGRIIDVNDSFTRLTGYTREEAIGKTSREINLWVKPTDREYFLDILNQRGQVYNEELEYRDKGGNIRTHLHSACVITINDEKYLITVATDITERKRMEQELRESEEKFSKAFHASPQQIIITRDKDDRVLEVNDSFVRGTGYSREELVGHQIYEFNAFANAMEFQRLAERIAKERRLVDEKFGFRTKSGEIRQCLCSAEVINLEGEPCVIYVVTDITEREKMERELRESEEKFSKIFQGSSQLIAVSRSDTNTYIDVNDAYVKTTGYSREELIGHSIFEINMLAYPEEHQEVTQFITKNKDISGKEFTFRMKSGELRSWICSSDTIYINNIPCSVATATDITERKKAAEELRQANIELHRTTAQLQATNKELESFSYSVSHDLRSPLRSINGFSQALLEDYAGKLDAKGQDYLNRIHNASQKMGELIDGLLRLSRLTRSEMHNEKVDLGILAKEIITNLQETDPERNVKFILGNNLVANGDPELLRVLLQNLLNNAWKFTAKTPQAEIEFGRQVNDAHKSFFIRDNGAGFDMAFRDKLFGAFQRLHDVAEFPGTGIGLATVQRIVNRYGGTISVEGKVGQGATFSFSLNGEV